MASFSDDILRDRDVPLEEIVFSCCICQATVSDVYAEVESNHGFHSGSGDSEGIVTKFWVTDCSHVICGKHLEGGAVPFHPKGAPPRAPCPCCVRGLGDHTPRNLYGIRGLAKGKYDQNIPEMWTHCPPIRIEVNDPEMEAIRFQYTNLTVYARGVTRHWRSAERKQHATEDSWSMERKHRRKLQVELLELKPRIEELKKAEAKLKAWESRKDLINHYMGIVTDMSKDMTAMRQTLTNLGYEVPTRSYRYEPEKENQPKPLTAAQAAQQAQARLLPSVSPTVQEPESSSSARKRKRTEPDESGDDSRYEAPRPPAPFRPSSRQLMPPPLPKFNPPTRSVNSGRISPQPATGRRYAPPSRQSIQVYEDQARDDHNSHFNQQREHPDDAVASQARPMLHASLPIRPNAKSIREFEQTKNTQSQRDIDPHQLRRHLSSTVPRQCRPAPPLSLHSPERHQNIAFDQRQPLHDRTSSQTIQGISRNRPHAERYESDSGAWTDRRNDWGRKPLHPYSQSMINLQPPTPRQSQATSSRQRHDQPQAPASVISPGFRRDTVNSHPTISQRPPLRESLARPQYSIATRDSSHDLVRPPSQLNRSQYNGFSQRPPPMTQSQRARGPEYNQPLYQTVPCRPGTIDRYQQRSDKVAQTPRNSQGLLVRPDRLDSSYLPASRPPSSTLARGRVSLPPASQTMLPVSGSQEQALSQIPGVRGGNVYTTRPASTYQSGSMYNDSRALFSSAGRRSIRR